MNNKFVSVIMPSYNTRMDYLDMAVKSIINQSYIYWELIIIDDGSEVPVDSLNLWDDKRIKILRNEKNCGITYCLNVGISRAKGEYIFRMDSDDVSECNRIAEMVSYMEKHKKVEIAGSAIRHFGGRKSCYYLPENDAEIKAFMFLSCPFIHPSVVFRRSFIEKYSFEYCDFPKAEDYYSWLVYAFKGAIFGNNNKVLLRYRIHSKQITASEDIPMPQLKLVEKILENSGVIDASKIQIVSYWRFMFKKECDSTKDAEVISDIRNKICNFLDTSGFGDSKVYIKQYNRIANIVLIRKIIQRKPLLGFRIRSRILGDRI